MRSRGRLLAVLGMGALLMCSAGCSSVEKLSFPSPPTTQASSEGATPTLPDNLSSITQPPVAGATTTTVPAVGPGAATLNGSVFGPTGPVGGATVEADRVVGNQVAAARAITAADGSWRIPHILGGVYRVRAWHAPNLDLTTPQVLFLSDDQNLTVSIELSAFPGPNLGASIAPASPQVGQAANLLVQVTNPTIGADGVLSYQPVAGGSVQLTSGPGWIVSGTNPAPTNAAGEVLFQVQCQTAGSSPLIATVGAQGTPVSLKVPACAPAPTPTTSTPTSSTTAPCPSTTVAPPANPTNPTIGVGGCG
jgi:Carboxypeptidase regulatory-like domain